MIANVFLFSALFVTSSFAVEREGAESIQKCSNTSCSRESYAALPTCGEDERPRCDEKTLCPTCVVKKCDKDLSTLEECAADTKPTKDDDGCPTCKPFVCPALSTLDPCEANVRPTRNEQGCYTCRPVISVGSCTREQLATSCSPDVPECAASDIGRRHDWENCCQTCVVPDTVYECATADAVDSCRALLSADSELLPVCAEGQKPQRDVDTCCYDCKVTPPPTECVATREAFRGCLDELPTCADGEAPVIQGCCPSCNPFLCTADEVAKCAADRPDCSDTVKPVRIEGECCPSCIPRPVCDTDCGEGKVCLRDECRSARRARLLFSVTDAEERRRLAALSREEAREFIREKIARFCARAENEERCARLRDSLESIRLEYFGTRCAEGEEELTEDRLCARLAAVNENTEGEEVDVEGKPVRDEAEAEAGIAAEKRADNSDTTMGIAASAVAADGDYVEESTISASLVAEPEDNTSDDQEEGSSAARILAAPLVAVVAAVAAN